MLLYSALYSVSLLKVSISSHEVLIEELGTYIWFKEVEYVETFTNYCDKTFATFNQTKLLYRRFLRSLKLSKAITAV